MGVAKRRPHLKVQAMERKTLLNFAIALTATVSLIPIVTSLKCYDGKFDPLSVTTIAKQIEALTEKTCADGIAQCKNVTKITGSPLEIEYMCGESTKATVECKAKTADMTGSCICETDLCNGPFSSGSVLTPAHVLMTVFISGLNLLFKNNY